MPEHTYDGPGQMTYPSSKDSAGLAIGTVEPGDIRDTDGPLDHWWRETTDEDRASQAALDAERDGMQAKTDSEQAEAEAATPAGMQAATPASPAPVPQPAPPAVIPQPSAPSAPAATQEG